MKQQSQPILAISTMEHLATARRVAWESNALAERQGSHAPQDAIQDDPAQIVGTLAQEVSPTDCGYKSPVLLIIENLDPSREHDREHQSAA